MGGEWSASRPDRLLPPGKGPRYSLYRRLCLETRGQRKDPLPLSGIESRSSSLQSNTTLTELHQLPSKAVPLRHAGANGDRKYWQSLLMCMQLAQDCVQWWDLLLTVVELWVLLTDSLPVRLVDKSWNMATSVRNCITVKQRIRRLQLLVT
jgi:hypothetical protein